MDTPEPTEEEHELASTERQAQEDDMRGQDAQPVRDDQRDEEDDADS